MQNKHLSNNTSDIFFLQIFVYHSHLISGNPFELTFWPKFSFVAKKIGLRENLIFFSKTDQSIFCVSKNHNFVKGKNKELSALASSSKIQQPVVGRRHLNVKRARPFKCFNCRKKIKNNSTENRPSFEFSLKMPMPLRWSLPSARWHLLKHRWSAPIMIRLTKYWWTSL